MAKWLGDSVGEKCRDAEQRSLDQPRIPLTEDMFQRRLNDTTKRQFLSRRGQNTHGPANAPRRPGSPQKTACNLQGRYAEPLERHEVADEEKDCSDCGANHLQDIATIHRR